MSGPDIHWVFGYGSLIWNPGFPWVDRHPAVLEGYHRAFCRYSFRHRGTPTAPGLVIGLREGGSCTGMAFLLGPSNRNDTLEYLDEREGAGYQRLVRPVTLKSAVGQRSVSAWVYVPNPDHPSYFGLQDPDRIAHLVAAGKGESGTAYDYLAELVKELTRLGVEEADLTAVLDRAKALRRGGSGEP